MKFLILAVLVASSAFAYETTQEVVLNSKEINLGMINSEKSIKAVKAISFVRNEYSPRKTLVTYKVSVKKYICTEWENGYAPGSFYMGYDYNCLKTEAYYVVKNKKFTIDFSYTVPLERGYSESFNLVFTQKHIESKKVSFEMVEADTLRVYEYIYKKNKLEAYIDMVRRRDTWW